MLKVPVGASGVPAQVHVSGPRAAAGCAPIAAVTIRLSASPPAPLTSKRGDPICPAPFARIAGSRSAPLAGQCCRARSFWNRRADGASDYRVARPRVGAGVAACDGDRESLQVVPPAGAMEPHGRGGKAAMGESDEGLGPVRRERDLDRGRLRGHTELLPLPAPGEHEAPW